MSILLLKINNRVEICGYGWIHVLKLHMNTSLLNNNIFSFILRKVFN